MQDTTMKIMEKYLKKYPKNNIIKYMVDLIKDNDRQPLNLSLSDMLYFLGETNAKKIFIMNMNDKGIFSLSWENFMKLKFDISYAHYEILKPSYVVLPPMTLKGNMDVKELPYYLKDINMIKHLE